MKMSQIQEIERAVSAKDAGRLRELVAALPKGADCSQHLELAAGMGELELVEILIPASNFEYDAGAALEAALRRGSSPCALRLIEVSKLRNGGVLALERAAFYNQVESVRALCKKIDPKSGRSQALRVAVAQGAWESVEELDAASDFRERDYEALLGAASLGRMDWVSRWVERLTSAQTAVVAKTMEERGLDLALGVALGIDKARSERLQFAIEMVESERQRKASGGLAAQSSAIGRGEKGLSRSRL